jgi:hypothetical protein
MTKLREAILTHWATSATLAALDGPWHSRVPGGRPFPHAAFLCLPPGPVKPFFKGGDSQRSYIETCVVRFMIYSAGTGSDATVSALQDTLHSHFDEEVLTLASGGKTLAVYRDEQFVDYAGTDASDQPVYHAVTAYRYVIQRDFPA